MSQNFNKVIFPATANGVSFIETAGGQEMVTIKGPGSIPSSYTLTLPSDTGLAGNALTTDGTGVLSWSPVGTSSTDSLSIISNELLINNTTDIIVGYFPWDSATFATITNITCILWYGNIGASTRNLIVSTNDGTFTSSVTVVAPSPDNIITFAITKPSSNVTISISARRGAGSGNDPIIKGISFQLT